MAAGAMTPSATDIARAVSVLKGGGLVAFPTETVYGLGADALNPAAIRKVFAVKGRPADHPLIVHIGSSTKLEDWALKVPEAAERLARRFWPGPLTLVLKRHPRISLEITGGQETVAIRIPAHPAALMLLDAFGSGIAAPSANRFGKVSPTTAAHVRADLGMEVDFVLDGGPCAVGIESTIVDLSSDVPIILRPGGIAATDIERELGSPVKTGNEKSQVRAPGMLESHYAPRARIVIAGRGKAQEVAEAHLLQGQRVCAWLGAGPEPVPESVVLLPVEKSPEGRARTLYSWLREVDVQGFDVAVVTLPLDSGLDAAVRDRLCRAAGGR